ncbi:hypothetical protein VQL36_18250 [Chengkuizengella sp. SCS-71B]|uniref:hypothetical protein n=1 Tax=Chengkuizengella sp. SCS-71B TaxID=3115290 RepID=UPI0032C233CA
MDLDTSFTAKVVAEASLFPAGKVLKLGKLGKAAPGVKSTNKSSDLSIVIKHNEAPTSLPYPMAGDNIGIQLGKGTDEANYVLFNKTHKNAQPKPRVLGPIGGRLQSHHGLQQEWAKNNLGQNGYNPALAPTMTLETGKGLPHTIISTAQNTRRNKRVSSGQGKWRSSLQDELQYIVDDFTKAGFNRSTIEETLEQQYKMLDKLKVPYKRIDY